MPEFDRADHARRHMEQYRLGAQAAIGAEDYGAAARLFTRAIRWQWRYRRYATDQARSVDGHQREVLGI